MTAEWFDEWERDYPENWFARRDGMHVLRDRFAPVGGLEHEGRLFLPPAEWAAAKAEDDALKTEMLEAAGVKPTGIIPDPCAPGGHHMDPLRDSCRKCGRTGMWIAQNQAPVTVREQYHLPSLAERAAAIDPPPLFAKMSEEREVLMSEWNERLAEITAKAMAHAAPPKDALMQWPEMKGHSAEPAHEGGPVCSWLETLAKEAGLPNAKARLTSDGYEVRAHDKERDVWTAVAIGEDMMSASRATPTALVDRVRVMLETAAEDLRDYSAGKPTTDLQGMIDSVIAAQVAAGGHDTEGTRAEAERWLAMVCSCVCEGLRATTEDSAYRVTSADMYGTRYRLGPNGDPVMPPPLGRP